MMLEYARVRPDAKPPTRANPSDAGLDLYFNPVEPSANVRIEPGESKLFQTGIRVGVPHGYMLEIKNRSSIASKKSLLVGACVVDSGYDGEIFVNLHNVGNDPQYVTRHDKIAQAVLTPVVHFRALETHAGDLYGWHQISMSNRGSGALGSTD